MQGAKPELIAKVVYESGETCDWLQGYGFEFGPAVGFVGGKWAIFSSYVGGKALTESYFAKAYDKYVEMGGEYLLETEATELLFEDGSCVGAKAVKADGTDVTIHAKAVLCCSGGYAGSELRRLCGQRGPAAGLPGRCLQALRHVHQQRPDDRLRH